MAGALHSSSWYRVAHLRPRLRAHVRIDRQIFRGAIWYVIQDQTSGRFNRFTASAYLIISLMDGERTVEAIWDEACTQLDPSPPTQEEVVRLLGQLHHADLLYGDVAPHIEEVIRRVEKSRMRKLIAAVANPMAVRIPVLDPDRFLSATLSLVRPLYSWPVVLILTVFVAYSGLVAASHWSELSENITDRVLAAESLVLLLLTYPLVKIFHELGHAYAVKRWGGEVHEIGLMFLVFVPVPYVDASASTAFRSKWRRAFVALAGVAVELVLAAVAIHVWAASQDGLLRAFAFNVMLICGVSTIVFNGNPLLRFDGYYALTDIIEIPSLATRANRYLGYLVLRYGFGVKTAECPSAGPGESRWFVGYGIASFLYRITVTFSIIMFVASQYFVIGVLLAIWGVVSMIGIPLGKQLLFLFRSPMLRDRRGRAIGVTAIAASGITALVLAIPLPYSTVAVGVVWIPGNAIVHAGVEGTVIRVLEAANSHVKTGQEIVEIEDPFLNSRVRVQAATAKGLRLRYVAESVNNTAESQIVAQELEHAEANLRLLRQRQQDLIVRSPNSGELVLKQHPNDVVGSFVRKGDVLGYVVGRDDLSIYVVVPEEDADLIRARPTRVELRFSHAISEVYPGRIAREMPLVTDRLPSAALSTAGGGDMVIDPTDPAKLKSLTKALNLEIAVDPNVRAYSLGERVYVRFRHPDEAITSRLYRRVRQVFLAHFHV